MDIEEAIRICAFDDAKPSERVITREMRELFYAQAGQARPPWSCWETTPPGKGLRMRRLRRAYELESALLLNLPRLRADARRFGIELPEPCGPSGFK